MAQVLALPHTCRSVPAAEGTVTAVEISGDAGGAWGMIRQEERWHLSTDDPGKARVKVTIPQEIAWRLFTNCIPKSEAQRRMTFQGDAPLGTSILDMLSIMATPA